MTTRSHRHPLLFLFFAFLAALTLFSALVCVLSFPAVASDHLTARVRAVENGLRPAITAEGEPEVRWTIAERMAHWKVPGMSIAVIRDGTVAWAKGYGVKQAGAVGAVDTQTMFSVGSVSKVGAATITLRMVDAGELDLDRDVNEYLSGWKVPINAYTAIRPVTLRGLLSHSAGLTVEGFPDFQPGEALPTVIDTLEGLFPAKTEAVRVFYTPGTKSSYSGGGITVEQLAIETTAGLDFNAAAHKYLFEPLGMQRSTYENPLPATWGNIARAHSEEGTPRALPRGWEAMPEMAASGLWTTPSDYAKLIIALIESYRGGKNTFLSAALAQQMMTEVGPSPFGLGPLLDGQGLQRRFFHDGDNDSYKAWTEAHLFTGNGAVILTNGARGTGLIGEVRRAIAAAEGWPDTGTARAPRVVLSAQAMDEFVGVYAAKEPESIVAARLRQHYSGYRVWREGTTLYLAEAGSENGLRLVSMDHTHFLVALGTSLLHVEFVRGYGGSIDSIILRHGEHAVEAQKAQRARRDSISRPLGS
jgi:CubicO group peptidase (beta-lactamase class C family)